MKHPILFVLGLLVATQSHGETTSGGIRLTTPWQQKIYRFAEKTLHHSAWGLAHSERNYLLAKRIAGAEGIEIDEDVLFAAAFLHDLGVFEPYVVAGAEHGRTAADQAEKILKPAGFPMNKLEAVKISIRSHMFYADPGDNVTARVLHDADTLDFLGAIGIARIISVTARHRWANDLPGALKTIEKFHAELPAKLAFNASKVLANQRMRETQLFIASLRSESVAGTAL